MPGSPGKVPGAIDPCVPIRGTGSPPALQHATLHELPVRPVFPLCPGALAPVSTVRTLDDPGCITTSSSNSSSFSSSSVSSSFLFNGHIYDFILN